MATFNLTADIWTQVIIGGNSLVDQQVAVTGGRALISLGTPSADTTAIDSSAFDDRLLYVPAGVSVYARPAGAPAIVTTGNYGAGASVAGYQLADQWAGNRSLSPQHRAAQKILSSAARRITPVKTVMTVPPTISTSAANGSNSTIIPANGVSSPGYLASNPKYFRPIGGPVITGLVGSGSSIGSVWHTSATQRRGGHGSGFACITHSQTIDFGLYGVFAPIIFYVTDLVTGIRARVAASDIAVPFAFTYPKLDFGSRGPRMIEFYLDSFATFFGCNVPTTEAIWAPPADEGQPVIGVMRDSWGDGGGSQNTNRVKLTSSDFWGELLGVANPVNLSIASTGLRATSTTANYLQRLQAGDADAARVGKFDLFYIPMSLNDATGAAQPSTDAEIQAAMPAMLAAARLAQPDAIIITTGPQSTPGSIAPQSRHNAVKAGFDTFAATDAHCLYIDSSAAGENYYPSSAQALYIGSDNYHTNDPGQIYVGYREAKSHLAALQAKYGR